MGPANGWLGEAVKLSTAGGEERLTGEGRVRSLESLAADSVRLFSNNAGDNAVLLRIENGNSAAMRLHLENFHLGAGSRLFVYGLNENGEVVGIQGPYTSTGPLSEGQFWTPAVGGVAVMLELQVPGELAALPFQLREAAFTDTVDELLGIEAPLSVETRTSVFRGTAVEHQVVDGLAIWEGDIILGRIEELQPAMGKNAERNAGSLTGTSYKWTNGIVPFTIDAAMPNQARITAAVDHWNTKLLGYVKLVPRTTETYYVNFKVAANSTCSSYLGLIRMAAQPINIGAYCSTGNVIHEIGHALGLYHEQTRSDRDGFVKINTANIDPAAAYNFQKQNSTNWGNYDYASIMHYPAYAFSINGQPTIETIPAGIAIGQRSGLSTGDVAGIKGMYPASTTPPPSNTTVPVTFTSNPAGRALIVDNANLATPNTVQWTRGTPHTISGPNTTASGVRYTFRQWSDGGTQTHTVTAPTAAATLTATYNQLFQLTANATAGGRVAVSPASADGFYAANSTVTLTATANANYCLTSWSGVMPVSSYAIALGLAQPTTITANFKSGTVTAPATAVVPLAGGLVSISVNATSGCIWRATSYSSGFTIEGASTGTASTSLKVRVAASTVRRTGYVVLNSQLISITQR